MKKFFIVFSPEADMDMFELEIYIKNELKSPLTAVNYMRGLEASIQKLSSYADSISISPNKYIQFWFGPNARHVVFKKMTIIYLVEDNFVYIKRVIPSALIR